MKNKTNALIDKWLHDRGIVAHAKPITQAIKTLEEVTELFDALNRDNAEDVKDAIGDIYVTLRGVCLTYGVEMQQCIDQAYNEIKDRKGYLTPQGAFIKEK